MTNVIIKDAPDLSSSGLDSAWPDIQVYQGWFRQYPQVLHLILHQSPENKI